MAEHVRPSFRHTSMRNLRRLARRGKASTASPRAAAPRPRQPLHFETLEPRILLSTDIVGGTVGAYVSDPYLTATPADAIADGLGAVSTLLAGLTDDSNEFATAGAATLPALLDPDPIPVVSGEKPAAITFLDLADLSLTGSLADAGGGDNFADLFDAKIRAYFTDIIGDNLDLDTIKSEINGLDDTFDGDGYSYTFTVANADADLVDVGTDNGSGPGDYELRFSMDVDLTGSTTKPQFDLGRTADSIGLTADGDVVPTLTDVNVNIGTTLHFALSFGVAVDISDETLVIDNPDPNPDTVIPRTGIEATDADFFLDAATAFEVQAFDGAPTTESVTPFDLRLGFLDVEAQSVDYELDATLTAQLDARQTRAQIDSINSTSTDIDDVLTASGSGSFTIEMPVKVTAGPAGFTGDFSAINADNPTLTYSGNPFDPLIRPDGTPDPRTAPGFALSNFEELLWFNNTTSSAVLGQLQQLAGLFGQISASQLLSSLGIPFAGDETLGSAFDLAGPLNALVDELLTVPSLPGVTFPQFLTAQGFASKLQGAVSGLDADPHFDADTGELTFHIAFDLADVGLDATLLEGIPLNFNVDLGALAGIHTDLDLAVTLDPEVGFDFIFGIDLNQDVDLSIATALSELALAAFVSPSGSVPTPANGRLTETARFSLNIGGQGAINVAVAADATNATREDLRADIQTAIDAALTTAGIDDVLIEVRLLSGDRLALVSGDTPYLTISDASLDATESAGGFALLGFTDGQVATRVPTPANGLLSGTASFLMEVGATDHIINVAQDLTNTTIEDLRVDVQTAVDGQFGAGIVGVTVNGGSLLFTLVGGSETYLRITDPNAVAAQELGIRDEQVAAELRTVGDRQLEIEGGSALPTNGVLTDHAGFTLEVDGEAVTVQVYAADQLVLGFGSFQSANGALTADGSVPSFTVPADVAFQLSLGTGADIEIYTVILGKGNYVDAAGLAAALNTAFGSAVDSNGVGGGLGGGKLTASVVDGRLVFTPGASAPGGVSARVQIESLGTTQDHTSANQLAGDVNAALARERLSDGTRVDTLITAGVIAKNVEGDAALEAVLELSASSAPVDTLQITAGTGFLGLAPTAVINVYGPPGDGVLSGAAEFRIRLEEFGGTATIEKTFSLAADATNESITDLVEDLNALIALDADLGGKVMASVVGSRIAFAAVEADAATLEIIPLNAVAGDELGLSDGGLFTSKRDESGSAFIRDASISASLELDVTGGTAPVLEASFGFVGIEVGSITGTVGTGGDKVLEANMGLDFVGDVTLSELGSALGQAFKPGGTTTALEGLVDVSYGGEAALVLDDVALRTDGLPTGITLGAGATLTIAVSDLSDVPNTTSLVASDFGNAFDFLNLSFGDVLDAFETVLTDVFAEMLDSSFLNDPLPVLGITLADGLGVFEHFEAALAELRAIAATPAGASVVVQDLVSLLAQALGVPTSALGLSTDTGSTLLKFELGRDFDFEELLPINVDLVQLLTEAGIDPGILGGLVNLAGSAGLDAHFHASASLDFSFDVQAPTTIYIYDSTGVDVTASARAQNVAFTGALGPFGVVVDGGSAALDADGRAETAGDATFSAGFDFGDDGLPDDRMSLASLLASLGDELDVELVAAAGAFLPVYFPTASDFAGNLDFVAEFDLETGPDFTLNSLPDFSRLPDLSDFNVLDSLRLFVEGFDLLLATLDDAVRGQVFGNPELPLIGHALEDVGSFFEDIRQDVLPPLRALLEQDFANPAAIVAAIQGALFDALDPLLDTVIDDASDIGVKLYDELGALITDLAGADPSAIAQIRVDLPFDFMQSLLLPGFDLGLPALGLEFDGSTTLDVSVEFDLGFGVSRDDGFFFAVPVGGLSTLMDINVALNLPDTITGNLLFLQLTADNLNKVVNNDLRSDRGLPELLEDIPALTGFFDVTVNDADGILSFGEIASLDFDFAYGAQADVLLALDLGFNGVSVFPSLVADLDLGWGLADGVDLDHPEVPLLAFNDIGLNLGDFFSDFLGGILGEIQTLTGPIQPLLDILMAPIPVISDLAGEPITLVDIAEIFGDVDLGFVKAAADIITLINSIPTDADDLVLYFGSFSIGGTDSGSVDLRNPFALDDFRDSGTPTGQLSTALGGLASDLAGALGDASAATASFIGNVLDGTLGGASPGFNFPIINDPGQIFGLLLGRDAVLMSYDMPEFVLGFEYEQFFPIWDAFGVEVGGSVGMTIDLAFGYDTAGIRRFAEGGFDNPLDLMHGFFIADLAIDELGVPSGPDIPEVSFNAGITGAAALNIGVASVSVGGGVFATIEFNLNDPDNDGRVRFAELLGNIESGFDHLGVPLGVICVFDVHGEVEARLFASLEILFIIDETWYFGPELPLISFDYSCPRDPILATDMGEGELRLNMGLFAEDRLYGNTTDHSEVFFAKLKAGTTDTVLVWAPELGVSESEAQEYSGVSLITAKTGFGNDTVDLSGITTTSIEFNLEGGDGDDTFTAGDGAAVFLGQGGNDTLVGGKSKDRLDGGAGADQLVGNAGEDVLIGGADDDFLDGGDDADLLLGGTGNDEMIGGAGNDRLRGGAGMDTLFGDAGEDVLAGEGDADEIHGGAGADLISGGGGSDHIFGDGGNDTIWADSVFAFDADNVLLTDGGGLPVLLLPTYLTAGHDTVEGGDDDDLIYGEDGNDFLRGNAGDDVIHGQRGADVIYGDDDDDKLYGQQENDVIYGNAGDDYIDGAEGNDILFGDDGEVVYYAVGEAHPLQTARTINPATGGKDEIVGAIGDDLIFGGADEDTLSGGLGNDVAFGDHGKVEFALIDGLMVPFAGAGGGSPVSLAVGAFSLMQNVVSTDALLGAHDLIYGAEGEDILIGGTAGDTIYGDLDVIPVDGDDVLIGDHGQVILVPDGPAKLSRIAIIQSIFPNDGGNDILDGSLNDDVIIGGAGEDIGTGGSGFDVLLGDNGLIRYDLDGNLDGLDLIKSGVQVVELLGIYFEVENDLADPTTFTFSGQDTLSGGEGDDVIIGGVDDDTLLGDNEPGVAPNAAPGTAVGEPGDDVILGDNGLVRYVRLSGADSLTRIETTDTTEATGGTDIADGNQGNDMILGGVQGDYLRGNQDDDIILGDNGLLRWDVLAAEGIAGAGDANPATLDLITTQDFALGGVDYITGNAGDDLAFGGTAGDQIAGDNNASVLGGDFDELESDPGADVLIGDQGRIVFLNGLRTRITTTDTAEADGGVDTLQGNDYGDILLGGVQGDFLHGEAPLVGVLGVDDLVGIAGNDILLGDEGELRYDVATDEVLFNLRSGVNIMGDGNPLTLDRIATFATGTLGGIDTLYGNDGADIAMGGRDGDTIYGDFYAGSLHTAPNPGADTLMGDGGEVHFRGGVLYHFATREQGLGGSDTIYGNDLGDAILGGFAGDFLFGEAAQADLGLTLGRGGADIILGDNGRFDYVLDQDSVAGRPDLPAVIALDADPATLDRVMTTDPTLGGNDQIHGNALGDTIFGGTGSDIIWGDTDDAAPNGPDGADGDDVILGDHGKRYPQLAPDSNFFAIDTQEVDAGAGDLIFGNGAEDRILGQQGDDIVFGGTHADDIIGGHNVLGGHDELDDMDVASQNAILSALLKDHDPSDLNDINDVLDGGAGDDLIAGDNAIVERLANSTNPRFQVLGGGLIYGMETVDLAGLISVDVGFDPLVTGVSQLKPFSSEGRRVVLLNHSEDTAITAANNPTAPRVFGNDVMAGGSEDDELFGELGDDIAQGDGLIERVPAGNPVLAFDPAPSVDPSFTIPDGAAWFTVFGDRLVFRVQEAVTDGDDYLEGNGGNDRLYGNLGQDDLIGGSSTLFGLSDATAASFGVAADDFARPDGADLLYGGAGSPLRLARLAATNVAGDGAVPADQTHGRDADVLMGDNANVYRLVGTGGSYGTGALANGYLGFNHDVQTNSTSDGYNLAERIIARGVELVDYGYGFSFVDGAAVGSFAGVGMGDLIYGEGGDDIAFGMTGNDVIFGGGEDDDLYGGQGADWMSGGNGIDGILGDDGLLYTSRNATAYGEPLYGILPLTATNVEITTPGNIQREIINIAGELKKTANLVAFNLEGDGDADVLGRMNDILFGGLGTDYLHGGFGDDAMSGAEALPIYFGGGTPINDFLKVQQLAPVNDDPAVAEDPYWYAFAPYNPGDILRFQGNSTEDEFALYDEFFPRRKIMLDAEGNAVATAAAGVYDFLLNFDELEGPASFAYSDGTKPTDGDDRMFGDLGNDWMVGGSGRDHMWGGRGNDLLNMDDDHDSGTGGTHPNLPPGDPLDNSQSDEFQAYADIAYGGAGRDVLILNTGADRAIDWVGEYNSYIVPFAPFGAFHISRTLMPQLPEYLYALAVSDGTDTSIPDGARYAEQKTADVRVDDPQDPAQAARRGEPFGELGLVLQTDYDWQDQTGAPQDPQPGNLQGPREIMRRELFTDSGAATPFAATVGTFTVTSGKLKAAPVAGYAEAVSVYHLDQMQPDYMEILATVNIDKAKSGWKSNSYIIFDYQSPTDFKFAGIDAGLDKVRIGHRTEGGWVVDQQVNLQLREGTNYKLTLALHGTVASVYVNGANPASFDFRSALNDGLLGLGTDGAVARFDDFQVQKLPPVLTFDFLETFDAGIGALVASMGNWQAVNGRLEGSPGTADYAFAGRFVDVAAASRLELEAALRITGGSAGVVFDDAGDGVFKFAALLPGTDQVVLGHHTARGFVIDATASYALQNGTDYTLKINLIGTGASVSVNGQAVLGFVYNGLLNDGGVGLLVRDGTAAFDSFSIRGDDPAYLADGAGLRVASMGQDAAVEPLSVAQLEAALAAAGERLAAAGWFGLTPLDLRGISVAMEDLPGLRLAEARGHNLIVLDVNAAGHGWFADRTPGDDTEFRLAMTGALGTAAGSPAHGRMDLVSALAHELAHLAGAEHAGAGVGLMSEILGDGVRTLPLTGDSPQAVGALPDWVSEMLATSPARDVLDSKTPLIVFDASTGRFGPDRTVPVTVNQARTAVSDDLAPPAAAAAEGVPEQFPGLQGVNRAPAIPEWPAAIAELFQFPDAYPASDSDRTETSTDEASSAFWAQDEVAGSLLHKLNRSSLLADVPVFTLLV